jgi:photosystem II stability/assembly factor-like uncharacterized protein
LTAIAVSPSQSDSIYTGSSQGQAMVSRDGGSSWKPITSGLVNRFIKSIMVAPTDPNTAYITFSGFKAGHVFKTTDGGENWTDISGDLPDTPVNALLIDPVDQNIIYIGTDVGVFRSTVNGRFWERFNDGLPSVPVTGFAVRSDNTIQLATFGRGAYELIR